MKIKLLKKIRDRFEYTRSKNESGCFELLDHVAKKSIQFKYFEQMVAYVIQKIVKGYFEFSEWETRRYMRSQKASYYRRRKMLTGR